MNTSSGVQRWLPIASWLPQYRRSYVGGDLLAAVVVVALAVPQALGYASIAGVPVVVGIYAIPAALIAYAAFGSSPHLVVGPVSTVSVVSGSLVAGLSGGDEQRAIALTAALAIGCGVGLLAGGLLKVGWVAEFISRPIVTGFVFGLVLVIIVGELPKLLGIPIEGGSTIEQAWQIVTSVGDLDATTALLGLSALAILFGGALLAPRIPWGLIVLIGAIGLSSALDLAGREVVVVGDVPSGLPPFGLPGIDPGDLPPVLFGGIAMALVGLAEGLSAARIFAAEEGYRIDPNQEFVGAGAANVGAGLFGGLGVAGSLSKTAASRRAGGNTQMTGIFGAALTLVVLVLFASALSPLPRTVLSAIVIQAVWGLMDGSSINRYRRIRRNDFNSSIGALVGVVLFGPLYGLLVAVGMALLGLVYRSSRVTVDVMGRVPGEKAAWGSIKRHSDRRVYRGVLVLRLDSPLFWANASAACDEVIALVEQSEDEVYAVLLDLEATSQLDITSIDALDRLLEFLRDRDIDLVLVRVFHRARGALNRSGFTERLSEDRIWHSISAGVRAARSEHKLRLAEAEAEAAAADAELVADSAEEERIAAEINNGDSEDPADRRGLRRLLDD